MDIESYIMGSLTKVRPKSDLKVVKLKEAVYFQKGANDMFKYIHSRTAFMRRSFLELLKIQEFHPLNQTSTKPTHVYGMVTSIDGSTLKKDCYIQNIEDQSNTPVKLNLEDLNGYSLFKGQFIAVKGINPQGNEFIAEKIYCLPTVNMNSSKRGKLELALGNGPFTPGSLEKVLLSGPNTVLLLGPFTSFNGEYYRDYKSFIGRIEELSKNSMDRKVVLIPSLDDPGFLKVFPQPAICESFGRLHVVSNPGLFYLNEHLVSVTNFDIVDIMMNNELYSPSTGNGSLPNSEDPLLRASYHLAFQRSFMPVFPVDLPVAYGPWLDMEIAPDLLITASCRGWFSHATEITTVICTSKTPGKYYSIASEGGTGKYNISYK
ncbi:DNA polymerase alpha subunit B [Pancytospora epiphaga]|nr:DNA polymerase alpha subunit B [Pancytospora epiphaga]